MLARHGDAARSARPGSSRCLSRPAARGEVPYCLPGKNPFVDAFAKRHGLRVEATLGGAGTTYPEFMLKVKTVPAAAPK
jgi:hypothetical protein